MSDEKNRAPASADQQPAPDAQVDAVQTAKDRRYVVYLIIIAVLGWSLASFDSNLLTLTMPDIAKEFHLDGGALGVMGFVVYGAEFLLALFVGWGMDRKGRKWMWMFCLAMAAIFTGLTFFVQDFWQLILIRALASGFAQAELAVSITLVNEQVPSKRRGMLYSIVQGGWPIGVFMASGLFLVVGDLGWRWVYLFGVIPLLLVAVGRKWVRESERYTHLRAVKKAVAAGDKVETARLQTVRPIDIEDAQKAGVKQLFATPGIVRSRLVRLTVTWLLYSTAYVATNVYITSWLTTEKGWSAGAAATLLLVCGGVGFFFYLLGGALGERFGRKPVLVVSGLLVGPLNLVLFFVMDHTWIAIIFFLIYQATNGTWSGAGYSYQAEAFPTRVRAIAVGWMGAMFVGGLMLGSMLWSVLSATTDAAVTWIVIAVVLGCLQGVSTLFLPHIKPGQELEEIAQ